MLKSIIPVVKIDRFVLEINISQKCNYDCKYCPLHINGTKFTPLDFDKLFSFSRQGDWDVYIYGGEPLIHPQIFELLDRIGTTRKVIIQTNLSVGPKIIKRILDNYPNVIFGCSYHYEYAKLGKFMAKVKLIYDAKRFEEISVMWLSKFDKEIYRIYKIFRSVFEGKVLLTPTIPDKDDAIAWVRKEEFHKFLEKYSPYITGFSHEIYVNGVKKTVLEAYADNDDLYIRGMKCMISKNRITYDGHTNEWRNCAADVIYKEKSTGICHRYYGCAADLGFEKHFDSDIDPRLL